MLEKTKEFAAATLGKLNEYTFLQVLWMIEIYYLGVNSIFRLFSLSEDIALPDKIMEYNNRILQTFDEYYGFVLYLAVALILCGCCFVFIKGIDIISKYELIYRYSVYGATLGAWLLLMYYSYFLFKYIWYAYIFAPLLACILSEVCKFVKKCIKKSLGYVDEI